MPIYAPENESKDWETPPPGLYQAICIDVVDKGIKDTGYGPKHKIQLRWIIDARDTKDRPFMVMAQYTLSMFERAPLRKTVESWQGRRFTEDEAKTFDFETLIGKSCQVQLVHSPGDGGKVWANVSAVVPLGKGQAPLPMPKDYIRVIDKTPF